MKLELNGKLQAIIDDYNSNMSLQRKNIKETLKPYMNPTYARRFTTKGLKEIIKEEMRDIYPNWKKYDSELNKKVKETIADSKALIMKELGIENENNKSSDYEVKISNAIQFLKIELEDKKYNNKIDKEAAMSIDIELHRILKNFINDYNTMKMFKKMVETKVENFFNLDGTCIFPKTFGKLAKVESVINTLDEIEASAEMLFLYEKDKDDVIRINGLIFNLPMNGYKERLSEKMIVENALILDNLVDEISCEGQAAIGGSVQKTYIG